jgi:predicted PurR-regulated permease PerM
VILVGVLGGLMTYGVVGIFIGPVILAVFHKLMAHWVARDPNVPPAAETRDPVPAPAPTGGKEIG